MSHRALAFAAALLAGAAALPAQAQTGFEALAPMAREDLDAARGAVMLPNGFELGFGALVSTYVDGELALQTQLTWTETGTQTDLLAGAYTPDLAQAAAESGIRLGSDVKGLLAQGAGGGTVVVHDLTDGRLGNLVINTANARDIRQTAEITLNVPQLDAMQRQLSQQSQLRQLQNSLGFALRDAAR